MSAVLLAALGTGCLIPQSVDPIQTRPHTVPRVDPATLPPYLLQPSLTLDPQQLADASPCHCQLAVDVGNIIADDPTVDIEIRIFLDYDLNVPSTQPPIDRITLPGSFNNPSTTRSLPGMYSGLRPFASILPRISLAISSVASRLRTMIIG